MKALSKMNEGGHMAITNEKQKTIVADEQIVELYWARNEKAIQLTDDKYGPFLYHIAYNILHDRLDCEECQNDTYNGIWHSIPPHRPEVFSIFISKIMRNIAGMRFRERTRQKRIPSEMTVCLDDLRDTLHSEDSPETEYLAKELGKYINDYLSTLTDRQQYVFVGRFYIGDKLEVIAAELNVNISTVHRELERIKQGLKSHLERNGVYV